MSQAHATSARLPGLAVPASIARRVPRACAWLALSSAIALFSFPAQATTLAFELAEIGAGAPQPVDGINVAGVSFAFDVGGSPSADATYGADGPTLTYVDGRVLEGIPAGVLTLTFDVDVSFVEFGVALNTIGTVVNGFSVELFDSDLVSLGTTSVDTNTLVGFSEGFYSSGAPLVIAEVVITFDDTFSQIAGNRLFLVDNLSFEAAAPIPEASTGLLVALGVAGLLVSGRLRRR